MEDSNHFTVGKLSDELYVIQENISYVHPIYTNDPLNLYLLLGEHSSLLIDTGCGLAPLKPIVEGIVKERDLIVINSHAHWDHILGNEEFEEVYIHENEAEIVSNPYNLAYHRDIFGKRYGNRNLVIPPCNTIKTIKDGDIFDLGGKDVEVIHAPGHSPGSVCLLTSENKLFTGDVAYYGDQFLPRKEFIPRVLETLSNLISLCKKNNVNTLYPSHQKTPCGMNLLKELYEGVSNIDQLWHTRKLHSHFYSWIINDPKHKRFRYLISRL